MKKLKKILDNVITLWYYIINKGKINKSKKLKQTFEKLSPNKRNRNHYKKAERL